MPSGALSRLPDSVGIKALGADGLAALVTELGQPRYRADQLLHWLYGRNVTSYAEMTDLPAGFREVLGGRLALIPPRVLQRQISTDGTRKYLIRLADGVTVETVGLPTEDRLTVCFSTQAGCAMGCSFCATGTSGLVRDLGPGEMVDQLNVVAADFSARVTNAVAMGQGEPFANYDATLAALRLMNHPKGLGIGARHLTVSTCGLVAGINRFATEPEQFTLAVSLHSAVQATRDRLMPGVRGLPLSRLREALADYAATTGRRPSVEYALVAGVNDSDDELEALTAFCQGLLIHVNLIPVNPATSTDLQRPEPSVIAHFERVLRAAGIEVSTRTERGGDIDAACGQLTQHHRP